MIVPIELRLRAKALGLSVHRYVTGGWVLVKLVNSKYVAVSKLNATLQEIAAELAKRETRSA